MTTSLIDLLRDCLPIHAAWSEGEKASGGGGQLPDPTELKAIMTCLGPGDSVAVPTPDIPTLKTGWWQWVRSGFGLQEAIKVAHLWDWKKGSVNQIVDMNCRARETGYRRHGVVPKITFGLDGKPEVKVKTKQGQDLTLKLEQKYLVGQFAVKGGWIPKGGKTLWPLEALLDSGLVMVFVYELSWEESGKFKEELDPLKGSGSGNWAPVNPEEKKLMNAMAPGTVPDRDAWLEVMTGPFMEKPGAARQTVAQTGSMAITKLLRPRIVVALSMATCRERADFEPGGLVGMSKVFPNIMVCSSVELLEMKATVKIERTAATTALDEGDKSVKGTCCNAYDKIGSMFVTDANEVSGNPQKPFWGGTFAYLQTNADARFSGKRLKVVDRSKTKETRMYDGGKRFLVRRLLDNVSNPFTAEFWWSLWRGDAIELLGVEKVKGQGEFDNLHQSPGLKLDLARIEFNTTMAQMVEKRTFFRKSAVYVNEPEKTGSDHVWMAPFCSHDCLHTHWRWGSKESKEWTKGWDEDGPHRVSGAPMVPLHQDVEMELHGPNAYSYHVHSKYGDKHRTGEWDVVMHHGFAYAQSIAHWLKFNGAKVNIYLEQGCRFIDSKGNSLGIGHSPLMYWLCRYDVYGKDGKIMVRERLQFSPDEIDGARKT
jgi:hypothetical protein